MDRRDIEVFVAVMQLGSVSAAARILNMAQPSVSKAIALIERKHGVSLFERRRGRLHPTDAATQLIGEATRMEEQLSRFDRHIDSIRNMGPSMIRVAATPSLSLSVLPRATKQFRATHGDHSVILDMHPNHDIISSVERRQYDLGLLVRAGREAPEGTIALAQGRIVCVFPDGDPLGQYNVVRTNDIEERDLITITTDMGIVTMLTGNVPGFDRRTSKSLETNRYNIAVNLVRNGLGVTLVDEFTMLGMGSDGITWRLANGKGLPRKGVKISSQLVIDQLSL